MLGAVIIPSVSLLAGWPGGALAAAGRDCSSLVNLTLPDVTVRSAVAIRQPVAHCRVEGTIGGKINFSLWLPDAWNGRFTMGGAGGFVAPGDNQALRFGMGVLERGFATASTDVGHQAGGLDGSWALDDYEAIVNYGHLAMHRTVASSKAIIRSHYGGAIDKSFFFGCSNGGRQALQEAQRYPRDFDGIVAGAPALNFTGVGGAFLAVVQKMYPDPDELSTPLVSPVDRALLRSAIVEHCDLLDGVADGVLSDPTACEFDPTSLACDGSGTGCLSDAKLDAIRTVYGGPRDASGPIFFGYPFGAEDIDQNGWGSWLTGGEQAYSEIGVPNAAYAFGVGIMRYFVKHDPDWNYDGYDFGRFIEETRPVAAVTNATNPDLSAFRDRGGKLLMFHGWADVALSARMSTDYVERVYAHDPAAREDVRLFMMPGVLHCAGGPGPSLVDWLAVLERWHDSGEAPAELTARYLPGASGARPGGRLICAWPSKASYRGGDPDSARSYECR